MSSQLKNVPQGIALSRSGAGQTSDCHSSQSSRHSSADHDEKHQFRLIVSPEDADELDLTDYVQRLMTRVERDLGRKLEWAAVNHHNTDHPHAHIVIRGVDREGREELGPRRELDVRRAQAKEIAQERFISLDREIERRAKDNSVEVRSPSRASRINESTIVARLEHLESMRLAERQSPTSWSKPSRSSAHASTPTSTLLWPSDLLATRLAMALRKALPCKPPCASFWTAPLTRHL